MTLKELIEKLERIDPDRIAKIGFYRAHSYRGFYEQLAFSPSVNVSVRMMLESARGAVGDEFHGYKGGSYTMGPDTIVYLANYGETGEEITDELLDLMIWGGEKREEYEPPKPFTIRRLRDALNRAVADDDNDVDPNVMVWIGDEMRYVVEILRIKGLPDISLHLGEAVSLDPDDYIDIL